MSAAQTEVVTTTTTETESASNAEDKAALNNKTNNNSCSSINNNPAHSMSASQLLRLKRMQDELLISSISSVQPQDQTRVPAASQVSSSFFCLCSFYLTLYE